MTTRGGGTRGLVWVRACFLYILGQILKNVVPRDPSSSIHLYIISFSVEIGWLIFSPFSLIISIVWWIGSKGRRSLRRDFTRTLDSGSSVGVHPDPARHYRRSSCLVAQNQGPGGAQSLRHASLPSSGSPGKFFSSSSFYFDDFPGLFFFCLVHPSVKFPSVSIRFVSPPHFVSAVTIALSIDDRHGPTKRKVKLLSDSPHPFSLSTTHIDRLVVLPYT